MGLSQIAKFTQESILFYQEECMKKLLILLSMMMPLMVLNANVTLDYPGWVIFGEDKEYPGIPSKDIDDYKDELKNWSNYYDIELLDSSLNYASNTLDIGFTVDATVDVDGVGDTLFNVDYPISDQMRDIIFLQSLQYSIEHWKTNYLTPMGTSSGAQLTDTYDRAFKIYSIYKEYVETPGFRDKHANPIVSALFGAGSTNYGNIFETDGLLEGAIEDKIIAAGSMIANDSNIVESLSINRADVVSYATGFAIDVLDNSGAISSEATLILKNVTTGGFALAGGGVGLLMAPAAIFYNNASYLVTELHTSSQGAHLVNFYHFTNNYPGYKSYYLEGSTGGFIDWTSFKENCALGNLPVSDDPIGQALCNHTYTGYFGQTSATDDEKRTAYAIASLFTLVEGLDLYRMKKEIVARVKLEELKTHSFALLNSHLYDSSYKIRLPLDVQDDTEHGVPTSVVYAINDDDIDSTYPDALSNLKYITNTSLYKELTFDLSAYEATKSYQTLKATIIYDDGYTIYATTGLRFYPQIDSLELQDLPNNLTPEIMQLSVKFCGDNSTNAQLYYKEDGTSEWSAQWFSLVDSVDLGGTCKKYTLDVDGYKIFQNTGYHNLDLKVEVESATSQTYLKSMINPDDTDTDLLSDSWEIDYFGNLNQNAGDDFDNDGYTNYQEYLHVTDPTKAGAEGIIHTIYVNGYDISGDIWANVVLQGGTLDLNGRTLTVYGDFNQTNGTLKLNGGTLIVKGNYSISNNGYATGYLYMTNESDRIYVDGNFLMDSIRDHSSLLTAGILEVKGDFLQKSTAGTATGYNLNFYASGTHQVILSGSTQQNVSFEDPSSSYSHFNILEINNSSAEGVVFDTAVSVIEELITTTTNIHNLNLVSSTFNLTENTEINSDFIYSSGTFDLSEYNLTVHGDFKLGGGILDLNGSTLIIDGDFNQTNGTLKLNGGTLIVKGNYSISNNGYATGYLYMTNESDRIYVDGNFLMDSIRDHSSLLTAGILEVKGDFLQKSTAGTATGYNLNFYASGTHQVILSGSTQQNVSFEDPSSSYSHFNILEIDNSSSEGVIFTTSAYVIQGLTATGCQTPLNLTNVTVNGTITLSSSCDIPVDTDSDGVADNIDNCPVNANPNQEDIDGDGIGDACDSANNNGPLADNDNDGILNQDDPDDDNDGMSDIYEQDNELNSLDASDANEDADNDGYSNLEEYQIGTDPQDASSNSLSLAVVGKTKYFLNTRGSIGHRSYVDDNIYAGIMTLSNDTEIVNGTYVISGNTLTINRISPSASTSVLNYLGEDAGVMSFNISIDGGTESKAYFYDTPEERDAAINKVNPEIIMYLLN